MAEQSREQSHPWDAAWLREEFRPAAARQVIGSLYVWDGGGRNEPANSPVRPPLARPAERPVIGDELREVAAWCELGGCIARYADRGALGFADVAARALAAGWCKDGFGRMVCPACQQRLPIWSSAPVVPRTREIVRQVGSAGCRES